MNPTIGTKFIVLPGLVAGFPADALVDYTLGLEGNGEVRSVNPVVGETNDGYLNDIPSRGVSREVVLKALALAGRALPMEETIGIIEKYRRIL